MKKIILFILAIGLSVSIFAQDDQVEELKFLYESGEYDKIIKKHAKKVDNYSAKSIYYVGMAYYMKQDDVKCIEMMDLSLEKDDTDPDSYFIKGVTLNYLGKFKEAINSINKAIDLNSESSDYYSGLGDSYISLEDYEMALKAYTEATKKEKFIDRPYIMIPQLYSALGKEKEALKSFYIAKGKIPKESDSYVSVLYNTGLIELLNGNFEKAEEIYLELLSLAPNDYDSYSKLIQVYYGKKEYEKAKPYKDSLYKAYKKNILKDNLEEMFCFDQFKWQDKLVQVFERFEEPKGELYYKHLFYIVNQANEIEFRIQTENSPISVELGGPKYLLGMNRDGAHSTFQYGFPEDFEYEGLKKAVIEILEGKIKPTTTLRKNR